MRFSLLVGLLIALVACRSAPVVGDRRAASAEPAPSAVSSASSAASQKPAVGRFHEPFGDKQFPEGASDEMVCAAVHSSEKDPWFRFGHIIPFYMDGVVWVGEGSEQELNATLDAIDLYAPNMFSGRGKTCSRGGLLVYVEGLGEKVEDSIRRTYTLAGLEAATFEKAPVAKRVMRERFIASRVDGTPRFLEICRADADRCEQLLQVQNYTSHMATRGLCYQVLVMAQAFFARPDRSWWTTRDDVKLNEPTLISACQRLAAEDKVCAVVANSRSEREACWKTLAPKLGL